MLKIVNFFYNLSLQRKWWYTVLRKDYNETISFFNCQFVWAYQDRQGDIYFFGAS